MPTVLLVCEFPTLNGGERSMLSTLDGIGAAGFRPLVAAPGEGPLAEALRVRGIEPIPFHARNASGGHRPTVELREELAHVLRRVRPTLVHANSLAMGRLSGPVAAETGLPSMAHLRDIIRLSLQAVADLDRHTRLLAVSRATRDFHVSQGLSGEKTHVLYNGVDLERFRPRPATGWLRQELLSPVAQASSLVSEQARTLALRGVPLVGAIGQIALRKGQDVLVRAAAEVARRFGEVDYLVIGERFSEKEESRRFEASVRRMAEAIPAGRVHFLGVRDDVDRILNELTVLAHPARQEPLGRVLLEAAASGVPIVATDVGGTPEIFPPESQSARLIPPDDAGGLAAAICELLTDAGLRRRMAAAARRRAEEAFDLGQAVRGLVEHYQALAGRAT